MDFRIDVLVDDKVVYSFIWQITSDQVRSYLNDAPIPLDYQAPMQELLPGTQVFVRATRIL